MKSKTDFDKQALKFTKVMCCLLLVSAAAVALVADLAHATPITGSWQTLAPMPTPRSSAFVSAVGGQLYVAGGVAPSGPLSTFERYDPATDTWTALPSMPLARYQGAVAVVGQKIYCVGGWSWTPPLPLPELQIYDTVTNSWSMGPNIPVPWPSSGSADSVAVTIAGKIYVATAANGWSGWREFLHVYDPGTNTWAQLANSPVSHGGGAGGAINGQFYLAGGFDDPGLISQLDVYDPSTNAWATQTPMPPPARAGMAYGVFGDHLLAAGGWDGSSVLGTFEAYHADTDSWSALASMPTPRSGAGGAVIGDTFYVVGATGTGTLEAFTVGQIPEPSTVVIWSLLGAFGITAGWYRRRKSA